MNGFVIFFIVVFVVIPVIKNIVGAKPASKPSKARRVTKPGSAPNQATKNWAEIQKLLQQKINVENGKPVFKQGEKQRDTRRDKHGHSGARKNTHQRLHSQDGNTNVFTESHQARVSKRDQRDRSERNRIEAMLHSKTNRSIVRDGNNSTDGWGKRGDKRSSNGFLFLIFFGLIALLVLSKAAPELWVDILAKFRIAG